MSMQRLEEMQAEGQKRLAIARQELQTVHPRKVLIVDDESSVCQTLGDMLKNHDCEIMFAHCGAKAIDLIDNLPWDLVLLDLKMAGLNGIDVLRAVRPANPTLKIIVVTGFADSPMVLEALRLGTLTVMLKPVTQADIDGIFLE